MGVFHHCFDLNVLMTFALKSAGNTDIKCNFTSTKYNSTIGL